jgi:hypothetical protein
MDSDTPRPLSTEEAKARLRSAAQGLGLSALMGRRTWRVLALSLIGGFIVGRLRFSELTRAVVMQRVTPLLLTVLLRNRN